MTRILVVDDEPDLLGFVRSALEAEGFHVITATDGTEGLRLALTTSPDLVILDLLMPGLDGQAVLTALLTHDRSTRILVLSATEDRQVRVACLEQGAVDFLSKPFVVRELIARVRSRLLAPASAMTAWLPEVLRVGEIVLDTRTRRLQVGERTAELPQREFLLLQHLMRNPDAVCSRQELLSEVWGYDFDPSTNLVDVCIGRLRSKLRSDVIRTVRNVGYQLQTA
ncbi:response regulator transcription factor [Kribbella sp. CA-245084]|uniref:response regulator transcription factor n=1 Tax=Kribbella sp. CA-245084 TaxID=3239940 RepID=UPI003D8B35B3